MKGVLVDTSVWADHFRRPNASLMHLLEIDLVRTHPLVLGEIACGTPPDRNRTLADLGTLEQTRQASIREVIDFIERERLYGRGCGLVDMTLLASALMTPGVALWSLDKPLAGLARHFDVMHRPSPH